MVTQVRGKVDGNEIIFNRTEGDCWQAVVPLDLDGTYVIDLTATDDAGNEGYFATVLFTVDPETLHISMKMLKYCLEAVDSGYNLKEVDGSCLAAVDSSYTLMPYRGGYYLERGHICELLQ